MITNRGVNSLLFTFVSQGKENRRITKIQLGKQTGNVWEMGMELRLNEGDITVVNFQTIEVSRVVNGDHLPLGTVFEYDTINLLSENNDVFAIRSVPHGAFSNDYRMTIEWRITMGEMCWDAPSIPHWGDIIGGTSASASSIDQMVAKQHSHDNHDVLEKFTLDGDAPLYDDDGVVRVEWNKD